MWRFVLMVVSGALALASVLAFALLGLYGYEDVARHAAAVTCVSFVAFGVAVLCDLDW